MAHFNTQTKQQTLLLLLLIVLTIVLGIVLYIGFSPNKNTSPDDSNAQTTGSKNGICNLLGVSASGGTWKSQELINILTEAGQAYNVPPTALAGILTYEGYNTSGTWAHAYSDSVVKAASEPGGKDPNCISSSANARGPFQFIEDAATNGWPTYKNAVIEAGARPAGYTPEICNIKDAAYAAAKKMRNDLTIFDSYNTSCEVWDENPPPTGTEWSDNNLRQSGCHYYGKCGDSVCGSNSCYCDRLIQYYKNYGCTVGKDPSPTTPTPTTTIPGTTTPTTPTPTTTIPGTTTPTTPTPTIVGTYTPQITPTIVNTKLNADLNQNNCIGVDDFLIFRNNFQVSNSNGGEYDKFIDNRIKGDYDNSDSVDLADFLDFRTYFINERTNNKCT